MKLSIKAIATTISIVFAMANWSATANAQEFSESHLDAARKAMTAARSTESFDQILPQLAEQAKAELIRTNPDKEAQLTDIIDGVAIEMAGRRGDLEDEIALVFAKVFTEEELNAVAAFYDSEAGKKFLAESPIVIREMTGASQVWAGGLRRDMQLAIQEKLKEAGLQ